MCDTLEVSCIMDARDKLIAALNASRDEYPDMGDIISSITRDNWGHYLAESIDVPGRVAFARAGIAKYNTRQRKRTTLARYINRQYRGADIAETTIEKFAYLVQSKLVKIPDRFRVLTGDAIVDAYECEVGGHSCMTGDDHDESLVQVYGCNDNVSLLVYQDEKITARALLWTTDGGKRVLDRIYPNSGYHIDLFSVWCVENDVLQRVGNSLPHRDMNITGGGEHLVTLNASDNQCWPFMDTFRFTDSDSDCITLSNWEGQNTYCLESTTGGIDETGGISCCHCEDRCDEDSDYYTDDSQYCSECFNDIFWICDHDGSAHNSGREGSTYITDLDENWCQDAVDNYAIECECCDDMVSEWTNTSHGTFCYGCGDRVDELFAKVDEINNLRKSVTLPDFQNSEIDDYISMLDAIADDACAIFDRAREGILHLDRADDKLSALLDDALSASVNLNQLEGETCKN